MTSLLQHLRFALRGLRRSPAFTFTVVATLAIGIGLNAAIFTVVDSILLRPLGYRDANRIVAMQTRFLDENRSIPRLGGDDYSDLARDVPLLDATALYQFDFDALKVSGKALYLPLASVSPRFMQIMGVEPVVGRLFDPAAQEGTDALVSAAFARDHYGSPAAALGQPVTNSDQTYTIAGVLPDGFSFPGKTEAWLEQSARPRWPNRTSYNDRIIARRRAGVTPVQLDSALATFSANLQRAFTQDRHKAIEAVPLQQQLTGRIRPTLNLLMGSVAVILLIVCANLAHLQLVRATRELRAVTIRSALGASRAALAARALTEALLLAAAGTVFAILLAVPALHLLLRLAPENTPRIAEVHLNPDVLVFSFLVAAIVMLASALAPVWRSWHVEPAAALRAEASRGTEARSTLRLRSTFIVAEVALTLTLSVAAILLTRQLIAQSRQNLGFSPAALLTLDIHAVLSNAHPVLKDKSPQAQVAFAEQIEQIKQTGLARLHSTLATVAAVPGVDSAAAISGAPMGFGGSDALFAIKGKQQFTDDMRGLPDAQIRPITPGLFATLGIPILRGRNFTAEDRAGAPKVLIINAATARQDFPGKDPVGKQVASGYDDSPTSYWTIVGVAGDIRDSSPAAPPEPTFYIPFAQHPDTASDTQLVVRTHLAPEALAETLRAVLLKTHPELAVKANTMTAGVASMQRTEHFRTTLFVLFAAVSILLAAVGMYGVTAYTVAQRRFEFGLRIALGANHVQLLTMILRSALAVALLGVGIGTLLSLALQRLLGSIVGKLPAFDAAAYALAALVILLLALAATLVPARRAATVDPNSVLRSE